MEHAGALIPRNANARTAQEDENCAGMVPRLGTSHIARANCCSVLLLSIQYAMEVSWLLHDVQFIWNAEKAALNRQKHGMSFEPACEVFFDPFVRVVDAGGRSQGRRHRLHRGFQALIRRAPCPS